jgi:hypothetical protein
MILFVGQFLLTKEDRVRSLAAAPFISGADKIDDDDSTTFDDMAIFKL